MKGFVPTPAEVVDLMVEKLFSERPPRSTDTLLDPGCGRGVFIDGVIRWCAKNGHPLPRILGVDSDPNHCDHSRAKFADVSQVNILSADFLASTNGVVFDFIVGNPPYVPITGLSEEERHTYRSRFKTASGRFDLYLLFFEQALRQLKQGGRLVFITPEKFLYVDTARPLRVMLAVDAVEELHFLDEETFGPLVTYPLITTLHRDGRSVGTRVIRRDGTRYVSRLSRDGTSWLANLNGQKAGSGVTLEAICQRISCGVATGADQIFVRPSSELPDALKPFAHATIAGRELRPRTSPLGCSRMLVPYDTDGRLLPEHQLGALGEYLADPVRCNRLTSRTCARRKPWYAFHETPLLREILRPKLLCKDITQDPFFVYDRAGTLVPRHSVYYIIPNHDIDLELLGVYLNSEEAIAWLRANCQRAANGFLRVQSAVLKRLPVPESILTPETDQQPDVLLQRA